MEQVISTERRPIKLWLNDIEEGALDQAKNLANLPFVLKHIAILPDSHQGYGMPIGAVMAADGVVVPNAVGVDIGCGMCAVKTGIHMMCKNTIERIMGGIRSSIPVGRSSHSNRQSDEHMPDFACRSWHVVGENYFHALKQIGTLGGGNHFIELQQGNDGYVWIMIHSGSRNLGYKVANHYNKLAIELNRKWHTSVPEKWQLAFLPLDSQEGEDYLYEMQYCIDFAFANRKLMMDRVLDCICEAVDCEVIPSEFINVAHNYATMENHFGENVMIHRKGATSARAGQLGIIPGSQGTASYIVKGKGEPKSFMSCSHGAGRKMSRTRAQAELDLEGQKGILNSMGVIHGMRSVKDLDEAPGAYKDISVVMENQADLVDVVVELKPIAVIKG